MFEECSFNIRDRRKSEINLNLGKYKQLLIEKKKASLNKYYQNQLSKDKGDRDYNGSSLQSDSMKSKHHLRTDSAKTDSCDLSLNNINQLYTSRLSAESMSTNKGSVP